MNIKDFEKVKGGVTRKGFIGSLVLGMFGIKTLKASELKIDKKEVSNKLIIKFDIDKNFLIPSSCVDGSKVYEVNLYGECCKIIARVFDNKERPLFHLVSGIIAEDLLTLKWNREVEKLTYLAKCRYEAEYKIKPIIEHFQYPEHIHQPPKVLRQ